MIPIRVISLASRPDRRQQITTQLQRLGITGYNFLDAVNGKAQPDHPLFVHYDPVARARVKGRGRDLMPTQLGCFASHYLLWQECAASNQPMIVLEDDAILKSNFLEFLAVAPSVAKAWPLVWLNEYDRHKPDAFRRVGREGSFELVRKLKGHSCTVSYLLDPRGAAALLDYCKTWVYPVDDTMFRFYEHRVESIAIHPSCVDQDHALVSDIRSTEELAPLPLQDIIRRELYKARDELRRVQHNTMLRIFSR